MRNHVIYTLITISFLLLVVSCRAQTAGQEPVIQEETPPAPRATPIQQPAGGQPSGSGLRAVLEVPSSLSPGEPVKVQFFLFNESGDSLYVLNWFTPLEGLGGDIFRVTRDGQRVRYQGPLASRGDPTPEAYTLIEAGEMAWAEVDLSLAYDFSLPGNYTIEFVSPRLSHITRSEEEIAQSVDELGPIEIPSNEIVVAIGT